MGAKNQVLSISKARDIKTSVCVSLGSIPCSGS